MFSGILYHKQEKRFDSDKIQSCELLTKTVGKVERFMFIVQYKDAICANSLNDRSAWQMMTDREDMVRRNTVRGFKDKIYFAE